MGKKEKFIERMRYWCDEGNLGYDQSNRWDIRYGGECDCSSLVYWCLWEAGYGSKPANPWNHTLYTGTLQKDLLAMGFTKVPVDGNPKPGDVLLNDASHVAVCTAPGLMSYASIDERGKASGGQSGDQNGLETRTRSYYNYPWNAYYRPPIEVDSKGWKKNENGWWYANGDGSYQRSTWFIYEGHWYYFNAEGYAVTGWQKINGYWYFFLPKEMEGRPECSMLVGWYSDGKNYYYLRRFEAGSKPAGSMIENELVTIDGEPYAFNEDGKLYDSIKPSGGLIVKGLTPGV